jgi:hypothetical protein
MRHSAAKIRFGTVGLLALLIATVTVVVPTPALATERPMGVDTEVPPTAVKASELDSVGARATFVHEQAPAFVMLGVSWQGAGTAEPRVRVRTEAGWGPWTALEIEDDDAPDVGSAETRNDENDRTVTRPLWVGRGEGYELEAPSRDLKVHLVREGGSRIRLRPPPTAAAADRPPIGDRASWGARPPKAAPAVASELRMAFVHHTAEPNDYGPDDVPRILRGEQAYHMDARGWNDIGYNFVVDRFGRIWEARAGGIDRAVVGAHAEGFNTGSTGVAVMGTFTSTPVPDPAIDAVVRLLAWKLPLHGVDPGGTTALNGVGFNTVAGHRDSKATDCPGARLYDRLAEIRSRARNLVTPTDAGLGPNSDALGGAMTSGPGVASWGSGRLDVFVRGTDNALYQRSWDGTRWVDWQALGGVLTADPAAVSWGSGRIDVFVRGTDNALYQRSFDGGRWLDWQPLGGVLISGPGVSSWAPGHLDVFVSGTDYSLFQRSFDGGRWLDWQRLGGVLTSDPAAVSWGSGRIDVFVRGTDNALHQRSFDGGRWLDWQQLGGVLTSGPGVSSWASGRLDVFVRGTDSSLFQRPFDGGRWLDWQRHGGRLSSDPAAASWGSGRIDIFVRAPDLGLYHKWVDIGQ